jgi:hypothetical protein
VPCHSRPLAAHPVGPGGVAWPARPFDLLVLTTGVLPRWLGRVAVAASPFLLVQAFGLGGVIANFGLALDLVGFLLLLIFVLASSVIGLRRAGAATATY